MARKTAQAIVDGYRKGAEKNRAQHVLEAAQIEGQIQSAFEVAKLLTSNDDPEITLAHITSWVTATLREDE